MLNGYPLNSAALNSLPASPTPVEPPVPVDPAAHRIRWRVQVLLGGVDVTASLTGQVSVDREEGAAGVAEFALWYPAGQTVPLDVYDKAVAITFSDDEGDLQLFTGHATEPRWNPVTRILSVLCSDLLQQRIEAMPKGQVEDLVQGRYSTGVFGDIDSHWQYAQDRLSTRTASLDTAPDGTLRVTDWHAGSPKYIFGAGTTLYQSASVELPQKDAVTNTIELVLSYRYPRFQQAVDSFSWTHPAGNFCNWRSLTTELPDIDMVYSAASSAGAIVTKATWTRTPPTGIIQCGNTPAFWSNSYPDLLLGFQIEATRRWVQSVTDQHIITLQLGTGEPVTQRKSYSMQYTSPQEESYKEVIEVARTGGTAPQPVEPGDQWDEAERQNFALTALHAARTQIIAAHRRTQVSWSLPCSSKLQVDLIHTLELDDQGVHAIGKCVQRRDLMDLTSGSAITTLTIAVMRGGGTSDPITAPARQGAGHDTSHTTSTTLPTQLGGRFTSPPAYDETLDGFAGMYDAWQDSTLETFPRRLAMTTHDYGSTLSDAIELPENYGLQVGVPNDVLEL
jgi:hypothetical protein